jgi:hypothetical protein
MLITIVKSCIKGAPDINKNKDNDGKLIGYKFENFLGVCTIKLFTPVIYSVF